MKNTLYVLIVIILTLTAWRFYIDEDPIQFTEDPGFLANSASDKQSQAYCAWSIGDKAAFMLASEATIENHTDSFTAVMSWELEEINETGAVFRAGLSNIHLDQQLSRPEERANLSDAQSFFIKLDQNCLVVDTGFPLDWDINSIQLVRTQISNLMFALPDDRNTQWSKTLSDSIGEYRADFSLQTDTASPDVLKINRKKITDQAYSEHEQFGISIQLKQSEASAHFVKQQPLWWQSVTGKEKIFFKMDTESFLIEQSFSMLRDDQQFRAVPLSASAQANFGDAATKRAGARLPLSKHQSYNEARQAFIDYIKRPAPNYVKAAIELAAWLNANPADVSLIVEELRTSLDANARPTAFLALEMSGTQEAREALILLTDDPALTEADQAAATSALIDSGKPTREVADVLMARAIRNDMAANVSMLGIGTMVSRAEDPELKAYLQTSVRDRYETATNASDVVLAIDTVSNSGDQTFVDILQTEINAESSHVRRSSANALAKLAPDNAGQLLMGRLEQESDSAVNTTLVKALTKIEREMPEAVPTMASKLTTADVQQRSAIVDWLGSQTSADARALLIQQFKNESDIKIKKKIGRYVPARELQ